VKLLTAKMDAAPEAEHVLRPKPGGAAWVYMGDKAITAVGLEVSHADFLILSYVSRVFGRKTSVTTDYCAWDRIDRVKFDLKSTMVWPPESGPSIVRVSRV
jgi:hypothetical protein